MKPEEALALLHSGYRGEKRKEFEEAVEEALKKQIPMKPKNYHGEEYPKWVCPNCDEDAYYALNAGEQQYCPECGQCIDWKGVE